MRVLEKRLQTLERRWSEEEFAQLSLDEIEELGALEDNLIDFVRTAWPAIDNSAFCNNWAIEGLCEHLQAVTEGRISRLLVNFPPRCSKTLITSVCWPAWTWARRERAYRSGPGVKFLCGSYGHTLSILNSNLTRRLILSPWYQERWGRRFQLRLDQNTKAQFDNSAGGSRLATSVGGSLLGLGGDIIVVDDPHNTESVESEAERENVLDWWRELSTTRLNDPKQAAIVVIMQRLHEEDVSGTILSTNEDWVHYCVPMEYDSHRHCSTLLGWNDPRGIDDDGEPLVDPVSHLPRDAEAAQILYQERDGILMWPERFGPAEVVRIKAGLGPYMASGRLQQSPQPRAGGIFRRDWWQQWTDGKYFPACSLIIGSVDGAFTEKEENDPSAMTVWGVFKHPEFPAPRIILMNGWRKHLPMHNDPQPRLQGEIALPGDPPQIVRQKDLIFAQRVRESWGLVELIAQTCRKWGVHHLLIENKASGITAAQELRRLYGNEAWSVQLIEPKGDKVSRALSVQPIFANGLVYAPDKAWADLVITEMANFPKGKYSDLTDSATMALIYLRSVGLAQLDSEARAEEESRGQLRRPIRKLYPC
jgi:predicted phage terminase large subunit-like protein